MSNSKIHGIAIGILVAFFVTAYILPLGVRPLVRPDEFRYAEIPREMVESGDWVTPRLNGIRYFEKPALGYQLTALSFTLFGENAFSLRFPSALAVLLTAGFLYFWTAYQVRDPLLPGMATAIYLTFGLVFGIGTFAVLDSQLNAALTLTVGGFQLAWQSRSRAAVRGWLIFAGFAAGCAFLVKGFLAFAVPIVVIVPFLLWQRDWMRWFWRFWLPLLIAVAVALPWSWKIAVAEPDFWRYFWVEEHWHRFFDRTYDRGPQPFWYFLPILLGGMLPAGLLAVPGAFGIKRAWLGKPLIRFLLCWAVMPLLFFSASSCKLGTYILPCFPPLAVLLALALRSEMLHDRARYFRVTGRMATFAGWILLGGAGLLVIGLIAFPRLTGIELYAEFSLWPYVAALLFAGVGAVLLQARKLRPLTGLAVLLLSMGPAIFAGLQSIPTDLSGNKFTAIGLTKCLRRLGPGLNDTVLVDRGAAAATAWVLKRSDLVVVGKPGELEYGFQNYPEYAGRHYAETDIPEIITRKRTGRLILITLRDLDRSPFPENWRVRKQASGNGVAVAEL